MSDTSSPLLWPAGTDPAAWVRSWSQAFAPQNLVQPILPGWTFNINSQNSTAPQTEAEVVQRHSYGRQLGRIADALAVLIEAAPADVRRKPAIGKFTALKKDIDRVKHDAALSRAHRFLADLALLKSTDAAEFERLARELRATLERG